jgi:hypothetical protein
MKTNFKNCKLNSLEESQLVSIALDRYLTLKRRANAIREMDRRKNIEGRQIGEISDFHCIINYFSKGNSDKFSKSIFYSKIWPNKNNPCFDCSSITPGHHTAKCSLREKDLTPIIKFDLSIDKH